MFKNINEKLFLITNWMYIDRRKKNAESRDARPHRQPSKRNDFHTFSFDYRLQLFYNEHFSFNYFIVISETVHFTSQL